MAAIDRFEWLYQSQRETQVMMGDLQPGGEPLMGERARIDRICQLTLLGSGEAVGMLKALGHETHRPFHKANWDNAMREWVDQFKYLLAVAVVAGWQPEQLMEAFWAKSDLVNERFRQEHAEDQGQPVAVFDLDGVICHFSHAMTDEEFAAGELRWAQPVDYMVGFLHTLRSWGVRVVIITSRKVDKFRRIETDTEWWLRQHGVEHDRLIFAYDKSEAAAQFGNVIFAVEDSTKHALDYAEAGIYTFWVPSVDPDSRRPEHHPGIYIVSELRHLPAAISHRVKQLEAEESKAS